MKTNRRSLLVVAMLLIAFVRFAFPARETEIATVEATAGSPAAPAASVAASAPGGETKLAPSDEHDAPRNAFAVRVVVPPDAPPPEPLAPSPLPAPAPLPPAPDAVPPPPRPPPFEAIGTYAEGGASAVFLATPSGTRVAQPGTVLLGEYRVTGITAQHVTLTQESTQKTFQIPVPGSGAQ